MKRKPWNPLGKVYKTCFAKKAKWWFATVALYFSKSCNIPQVNLEIRFGKFTKQFCKESKMTVCKRCTTRFWYYIKVGLSFTKYFEMFAKRRFVNISFPFCNFYKTAFCNLCILQVALSVCNDRNYAQTYKAEFLHFYLRERGGSEVESSAWNTDIASSNLVEVLKFVTLQKVPNK